METLNILKKLIAFDSETKKSNRMIVEYLASLFPREFVKITKLPGKADWYNLAVHYPGRDSKHPLIFSGHTDTVPATPAWKKKPFEAKIIGNKIYGLGATDMKSGLAAMVAAARSIDAKELDRDVWFLFDADEEGGCSGGKDFLKKMKITPGSAQVVIGEPTGGQVMIGQKGGVELNVAVSGKAFHCSQTSRQKNLQFNAIQKAAAMITALAKLEEKLEKKKDPVFGFARQSVCKISGGTAGNVIPGLCEFRVNRRFLPDENCQKVADELQKVIFSIDKTAKVKVVFDGEASRVPADSKLLASAKSISKKVFGSAKLGVFSAWTQAGLFKKWGDCIIWGPGELSLAHQADEYCPLDQLDKMAECYRQLIKQK